MEEPFCCGCLTNLDATTAINLAVIDEVDDGLTYADCIKLCTNIMLDEKYNICASCISELKRSYAFYKRIARSQQVLNELASKSALLNEAKDSVMIKLAEEIEEEEIVEVEALGFDYQFEENATPEESTEIETLEICSAENTMEASNVVLEVTEAASDSDDCDDKMTDVVGIIEEDSVNITLETAELTEIEKPTTNPSEETSFQEIEIIPLDYFILCKEDDKPMNTVEQSTQNTEKKSNVETRRKRFLGKFCCDYCDKLFPNHSRMMLHRRCHEPDRPKYPCNECGRSYATNQALEVHINSVHNMSGYACKMCSKIFPVKASLAVHMRFHTGNFPYVCETCGHKFAQLCHLNTHRNVKHYSVRFCCSHPNCGKFFTSTASMRNHEYSHGMMPFECEFCHRGYPSKSKLKVHVRRAHKKELTLDELEPMRRFHVMRSKPNMVQVSLSSSKKTSSTE